MIEIFKILNPNCEELVDFDNSANHHAMSTNDLVANRFHLNDVGKNDCQTRDEWFAWTKRKSGRTFNGFQRVFWIFLWNVDYILLGWSFRKLARCFHCRRTWRLKDIHSLKPYNLVAIRLYYTWNSILNSVPLRCFGDNVRPILANIETICWEHCRQLFQLAWTLCQYPQSVDLLENLSARLILIVQRTEMTDWLRNRLKMQWKSTVRIYSFWRWWRNCKARPLAHPLIVWLKLRRFVGVRLS